ncbi:hypothetical protein PT2222_160185 [Paraburkholderia tropica]
MPDALRREALDAPGVGCVLTHVANAVVQPRRTALPEFDRRRHDAIAAPMRRTRRILAVLRADFALARFELLAAFDHRALLRRPGADARAERTRLEIRLAFRLAGLFDRAFDAHLTLEFNPVKQQRCVRIGAQFAALAAFVVREEHEAALVHALDQQDARGGAALRVDGGDRHGVRLGQLRVQRLGEPGVELADGIGVDVGGVERAERVVLAEVGEGGHVLCRRFSANKYIEEAEIGTRTTVRRPAHGGGPAAMRPRPASSGAIRQNTGLARTGAVRRSAYDCYRHVQYPDFPCRRRRRPR